MKEREKEEIMKTGKEAQFNYTNQGWEGDNYDGNLSIVEIAKLIRKKIKQRYPGCKFSIRTNKYSGGQSLYISLMESDFKILRRFEDLSETAIFNYTTQPGRYTEKELKGRLDIKHQQLGNFSGLYNPDVWNNGAFLTKQAYEMFQQIEGLVDSFNFDDSDGMIDYFHTNFYTHFSIGKWNKDIKETK
jgi:hypothetical protein